jgi:hypothetical protein
MALFKETKKETYAKQRLVSQGAGITLVSGCGEYTATFECATRIASVLGGRDLQELGDGVLERIPFYRIPIESFQTAAQKLSKRFSIALVDLSCASKTTQFILVWKIASSAIEPVTDKKAVLSLDDF